MENLEKKFCKKCQTEKDVENFRILNKEKCYRSSYCKPCENKINWEIKKEKGKMKEIWNKKDIRRRERALVDPEFNEKLKVRAKNWQNSKGAEFYYLRKYSLTKQNLENLYILQENKCKICKKEFKKLNVDHCHTSGKVRGLLCSNCNTGLGLFKDNSEFLQSALLYLKETNSDKIIP